MVGLHDEPENLDQFAGVYTESVIPVFRARVAICRRSRRQFRYLQRIAGNRLASIIGLSGSASSSTQQKRSRMKVQRAIRTRRIRALALLLAFSLSASARAQSLPTASRAGRPPVRRGFGPGQLPYNSQAQPHRGTAYAPSTRAPTGASRSLATRSAPPSDPTGLERSRVGPASSSTADASRPTAKVLVGRGVYNFSGQHRQPRLQSLHRRRRRRPSPHPHHSTSARLRGAELAQFPAPHLRPNLFTPAPPPPPHLPQAPR